MSDRPNTDSQTTEDVNAILAGMARARLPPQLQPGYRAAMPYQLAQADSANPPPTPASAPSATPGGDAPIASPPTPTPPSTPGSVTPGSNAPMLSPTPPIPALQPPQRPGVWQDRPDVQWQNRPQQVPQPIPQQQHVSDTQQKFIETYGPLAEQAGKALGVDPRLILGQWALESGWGAGPGAAQVGNMAGIKGKDGQYTRYNSPEEFADAYVRFLRDNPRYRGAIGAGTNADQFFGGLKRAGYFGADLGGYMQGVFRNIGVFGTVAQGQGPAVQPQSSYPPAEPRDSGDWGHPPPVQGGPGPDGQPAPGQLPQPSAFGRIMNGLAPLLVGIASLALRLPLSSAIYAYGAMARAQQNGEEQEYQRNRTRWRDQLGEATAQQALESRDASDAFTQYGHNNPQGLQQALMGVALKYNDPTMYRMAERGDLNGIYQLQQRRDALNQDLTKTHKAAEEEADRQAEDAAVKAMDNQWHDKFVKDNGREPTADEAAIAHNEHIGEAGKAGTKTTSAGTGEDQTPYNVIDKATGKPTRQVRMGKNGGLFDLNGQPTTIDPAKEELQPVARPGQVKPTPTNPYVQPDQQKPGDVAAPPGGQDQGDQQDQQAPSDQGDQGSASQAPAGPVQTAAAQPAQTDQQQFAPYQVAQAGSGIQPPPSTAQPMQDEQAQGPAMRRLTPAGQELAREYLQGGEGAVRDVPQAFRQPIVDGAMEMQRGLDDVLKQARAGKIKPDDIVNRVRGIDENLGDLLSNTLQNKRGIPAGGGFGASMAPFWNRIINLATAADPNWNPQQYPALQAVRNSYGPQQRMGQTLLRSFRLAQLSRALWEDAATLPSGPVPANELQRWFESGVAGDPKYTKFASDWHNFAVESQAVVNGGQPTVTLSRMLLDTLQRGATPTMVRQALQADLTASLGAIDAAVVGWRQSFPNERNPGTYDQSGYSGLYQLHTGNVATGELGGALPQVGAVEGGKTYLGGDPADARNWR